MLGADENLAQIFLGEVLAEHKKTGQVQLAGGDGIEERRKAPNESCSCNAPEGFVLRQAKLVDAIGVEARAGARAMDAASLHFAEVGEQRGEEQIRATDEASRGE